MLALILGLLCTRTLNHVPGRMIDCRDFSNWEPAECEQTSDGSIVLSRRSLADIYSGPEGLGSVVVDDRGLYFVSRSGRMALAFVFDNGTDNVVEGVARIVKNGKVGFVDAQLDQIVAPVWDFAFPFEQRVAQVCVGCVATPIFPGDEHKIMTGGRWGLHKQTREGDRASRIRLPQSTSARGCSETGRPVAIRGVRRVIDHYGSVCDHVIMTIVMSTRIAAGEFKAKCLGLLDEVQRQRSEIVITKRGKPVAKLVPVLDRPVSFIGSMKGTMEIIGDIVSPIDVEWEADE